MQWPVLLSAAVLAFSSVSGQDTDCMPPKPGEKRVSPQECCKMEPIDAMKNAAKTCMAKIPHPPKPSGAPPPMPSPEMKKHMACMSECVFDENKLLNEAKDGLDEDAVKKFLTLTDKSFEPVVNAATTKCLASYKKDIDPSITECKSGAGVFQKCALKEVFQNCPSSAWTSSPECTELKSKADKCPNMLFMAGVMGSHPQ